MRRAEYPLGPLGDVEPVQDGLDPEYDYARRLKAQGMRVACEFAAEIRRLRELYLHPPGLRRGSESQIVIQKNEGGFQAKLRIELDMHPQQAQRILDSADYLARLEQVAMAEVGTVVSLKDKHGTPELITVTKRAKELAEQAVSEQGQPGTPKPSRAWAGVRGEGMRVDDPLLGNGSKDRATPDNLELWVKAAKTIKRIGCRWSELFVADARMRAVDELSGALAALPGHVREAIIHTALEQAKAQAKK